VKPEKLATVNRLFTLRLPAKLWAAHSQHNRGSAKQVRKSGQAVTVSMDAKAFQALLSDTDYSGGWVNVTVNAVN